jgi:hypothetical protein
MLRKSLLGAALCAGVIVGGTGLSSAGEITGNGKSLQIAPHTLHGASICAFSGQNDTYSGDPAVPDEDGFTRTQNWGQLDQDTRAFLGTVGAHPGDACKPGAEEP